MSEVQTESTKINDEISLKELFHKLGIWWRFIKKQWVKIIIIGFIGACIGLLYAWMRPINYKAKITFVVEEGKSGTSSLGGLASLAGQFGVDVGGVGGGAGVLSTDNILLYFKSESLSREVLLSRYDSLTNKSIADIYAEVYELKKKWADNEKIGKVDFPPTGTTNKMYSRLQDSLIQTITDEILKTQFVVTKTDKKAGFIEVIVNLENELLSKFYCERIVKVAIDRYINFKTQKQKIIVDKLQVRVDSVANLLGKKTASGAALQTSSSTMDINPLFKTGTAVAVETTIRDKTMLATIFASAIQNLELAKFTLNQETPVIQVIDSSGFPLKNDKMGRIKMALIFSFVFVFILIILLIGSKELKSILD
jgi:hypothetical protein